MLELNQWPEGFELREWQSAAFARYSQNTKPEFLTVATPGAGKTIFALRIAHSLLWQGIVERVVIVCPSEQLKFQWASEAARVGIQIHPEWTNLMGAESRDYLGVAITYAQIARQPDIHRMNCKRPTLVILDEVHHAGDDNKWGDALRQAFEPAVKRLLLSGTPFRRKTGSSIPFVNYTEPDKEGVRFCKPDFEYGYGAALAEGEVCRPVVFQSFDGEMEWFSGGDVIKATFQDEIGDEKAGQRLRTAIAATGEWISTVIREADSKLNAIRTANFDGKHSDAGGLIIAMDQAHAKELAETLKNITGEDAALAISEDPEASDKIKAFGRNSAKWLIAVKMVSEGVDIKRLRVCIYATNVTSELFFIQAVGRILRWIKGIEEQTAYFYMPREECLLVFAQRIKQIQEHELKEEMERLKREPSGESQERTHQLKLYVPISSTGQEAETVFNHKSYHARKMAEVKTIAQKVGFPAFLSPAMLAEAIRLAGGSLGQTRQAPATPDPTPKYERVDHFKSTLNRAARKLAGMYVRKNGGSFDEIMIDIWVRLGDKDGLRQKDIHNTDQLKERLAWIERWMKEVSEDER